MYFSLHSDLEINAKPSEQTSIIHNLIDEFQTQQILKYGYIQNKLDISHLNLIPNLDLKRSNKFMINIPFFRSTTGIIINSSILNRLLEFNLPNHQILSYNDCEKYSLIYFYLDYFYYLDFKNSVFSVYERKHIIKNGRNSIKFEYLKDIQFQNNNELMRWENSNKVLSVKEKTELRYKQIVFEKFIYDLDIIPSLKIDHRLIVSGRLADFVAQYAVEKLDLIPPIEKP